MSSTTDHVEKKPRSSESKRIKKSEPTSPKKHKRESAGGDSTHKHKSTDSSSATPKPKTSSDSLIKQHKSSSSSTKKAIGSSSSTHLPEKAASRKTKVSSDDVTTTTTTKRKHRKKKTHDDDEQFLEDNDFEFDEGGGDIGDAKESAWKFLTHEQFLKELLNTSFDFVSPYVGFCTGEDMEVEQWKCLNVLRALNWNLGRVEEILDNPTKLYKKAGVLENPKSEKKVKKDSIECTVCGEEVKLSETSALECQHRFCNDCWDGFITSTLASCTFQQLFDSMNCMHRGCGCAILGCLVKKVTSEKNWAQYLRMLVRSYLEVNATSYSSCPLASCSKVSKANLLSKALSRSVHCECGTSYCFKCGMSPHVPASCSDLEKWKAKDTDDEASVNLIKATTTECPSCKRPLDRITACNHITCGCGYQFCFVCKTKWGSCSVYNCSKFTRVEDREKAEKKDFAPGFKTASEWLVHHERFVAFTKRATEARSKALEVEKMKDKMMEKSLTYREVKPGGNPNFIMDGWEILLKACNILYYTYIWGFFNIPAKICAQKNIFEWQLKNYEKLIVDLTSLLRLPAERLDHLKTKQVYALIESNLIKKIEDAEDLLALFSETAIGKIEAQSVLARWTCPSCNYSNHPTEQSTNCGHCGQPRPEVQIVWFAD